MAEQAMSDTQGRYGIYIKNFKTGEIYTSRETENFDSGSLYKLWVMKKVFEQIKAGKLKEDDILSADISDLNQRYNVSEEEAEVADGNLTLSVKLALEQMITISHNYSAMMLLDKVGNNGVPTEVTPQQLAQFLESLYKGELVDQEDSAKMMDLLSKQQINDRIPKLLPEGTKVAHKTGDLGNFENDAGIVFTEKGDYIFVVLSESDFPAAAGERIASLSEAVYKYFQAEKI